MHIYTGVQRKMKELVRERRKELRKEHSAAKSGVAVRDDEFVRTRDDWIEIHEVHVAEKKKLKQARDETKDDKRYRDNMAYRMGLQDKKKVPREGDLETSSESSDGSDNEPSQTAMDGKTKVANISAKSSSNQPQQQAPLIPTGAQHFSSNDSHPPTNSDMEKSPSPLRTISRRSKKVRHQPN